MTSSNPLWAPVLRLGSRFGLRSRESPRNFITNRDIASILSVLGFHVVEASLALPVPERIPVIGPLLNAALPDLPLLRYSCSTQYLAARPRIAREQLSVSVVVPCHNEEGNVCECARRVPDMGAGTEIIFVDDGSSDGTRDRILAVMAQDPRVRLLGYDTNHGKANAVRAGFAAARNDVLMILDADMSVAPEDLPKFLVPIQAGNAEFVNGTRLIYPIEGKAMPTVNFVGNKAFCLLVSWVLRQRVATRYAAPRCCSGVITSDAAGRARALGGLRPAVRRRAAEAADPRDPDPLPRAMAGESKMSVTREGPLFLRACLAGWRQLRRPGRSRGQPARRPRRASRNSRRRTTVKRPVSDALVGLYERAPRGRDARAAACAAWVRIGLLRVQAAERGRPVDGCVTRHIGYDGDRRRRQYRLLHRTFARWTGARVASSRSSPKRETWRRSVLGWRAPGSRRPSSAWRLSRPTGRVSCGSRSLPATPATIISQTRASRFVR